MQFFAEQAEGRIDAVLVKLWQRFVDESVVFESGGQY